MPQPFYAVIIPLGGAPDHRPGRPVDPGYGVDEGGGHYPDQGLPGGGEGEGGGEYPDQGLPGRPPYVSNRPPGSGRPPYPSQGPVRPGRPVDPGFGWGGGEHPGNRPPRPERPVDPSWGIEESGPNRPDQGLPPGPAQPWVPPSGEELPPPPEDIVDQVVLAIWNPGAQAWTVKTAPPVQPGPHG